MRRCEFICLFLGIVTSVSCFQSPHFIRDYTLSSTSAMSAHINNDPSKHNGNAALPERLIVGYANWNECDDNIVQAAINGVNVIIWFSINLLTSPTGKPIITNGPDMDCVADKVKKIRELGLETVHLISIGGWNSPHPDTTNSPEVVYEHWNWWNRNFAARPEKGFNGFDGFDWDIEGNDDFQSKYNYFTPQCLDLMGKMSQLAKQDGYIVAMAPAESYLDPTMNGFDRSLLHEYEEWATIQPGFTYHGLNTYAYLLDRYGKYLIKSDRSQKSEEEVYGTTFDFVTIQLYEGYSHAEYNITRTGSTSPEEYLVRFVHAVTSGWQVDFSTDLDLNYPQSSLLSLSASQLVIGLANGWAGDGKFLLVYPAQAGAAYDALHAAGKAPRGFAFWNILDEGRPSPQRPDEPVWMAAGLNKFLHIRKEQQQQSQSQSQEEEEK